MTFTWQAAEYLALEHMKSLGYADAVLTVSGADRGIDVQSSNVLAQVKFQVSPVGSPAVQRLRGAAHDTGVALFYSVSGYTAAAIAVAAGTGVALFKFDVEGHVTPSNTLATDLVTTAAASSSTGFLAGFSPARCSSH